MKHVYGLYGLNRRTTMKHGKTWTVPVLQKDDGEFYIELNEEIMKDAGFGHEEELEWIDNKDGSFTLKKAETTNVLVLVDCVKQYRMRYVVETPADHPEYALDTVTMEEAKEFSQISLGETIVSHRVISKEDMISLYDEDNDLEKGLESPENEEYKMNTLVTKCK